MESQQTVHAFFFIYLRKFRDHLGNSNIIGYKKPEAISLNRHGNQRL